MSSTRAEVKQQTQARVIDAAERLFTADGFGGTSIRGIAESACVSVGTVMSVGDKHGLLVKVFDRLVQVEHDSRSPGVRPGGGVEPDRVAATGAAGRHDTCPDRLTALTAPFGALFTRHDDLARVYASILVSGGHESELFADLATRLTAEFRTVITERSCTRTQDAAAKAGALYFAYVGLLFTASARRSSDPAELTNDLRGAFAAICACKE